MVALTAVTVSINYSDYLRRCVAQNAAVLDRWIIVTDQSDRRTIDICRHFNNIELVFTKVDFQPGVLFPKSRMINEGFWNLGSSDWILHLDLDILLPPNLKQIFLRNRIQPECMYGARSRSLVDRNGAIVGSHGDEFVRNIGFFQLFHATRMRTYPEESIDAGHDDMAFNGHWQPEMRRKLIGLQPVHFGPSARYWKGREPLEDTSNLAASFVRRDF